MLIALDERPVYALKTRPAVPASYEEALGRACALKSRLRERVPETERLRRLPAENVADLLENGLYGVMTWFDPTSFKADSYDPNKAKQLLQDAGYPGKFNPQSITLYTTAVAADLMQILQGYWQAVGINVDVQPVDTPVYNGLVFVRATELDDAKAKKLWQDMMHYGYDTMWINVELVEVPTYFAVGPNVGAFTNRSYINLWDSYVGIQHKA